MRLIDILTDIKYECKNLNNDIEIHDVVYDSRKATPADLFVCIKGFSFDGHDFAIDLYNKGIRVFAVQEKVSLPNDAIVILVDDTRKFLALASANYFGRPDEKLNTMQEDYIEEQREYEEAYAYKKEFVQMYPEQMGETYIVKDKIKVLP